MIYISLEGHDFKYDLFQLTKAFFPYEEIVFLEKQEEYNSQGYLLKSILYERYNKTYAKTSIYSDGSFLIDKAQCIDYIDIGKNSIKQSIKIGIKKTVYESLLSISDRNMPWGILTGIRPVKIVHDLLDRKVNEIKILNILTKEYKLAPQKAKLIINISKRQRKYIYPLNKDRFSLYISIPFCPSRCVYCSFPSVPVARYSSFIQDYRDKLIWEIQKIRELMEGKSINTVYIGGGTPTAIPPKDLEKIIEGVYLNFGEANIKEFTVEAGRPDTINKEILIMLNRHNIDRISINPQTMNDKTLKLIGRNHNKEDIKRAYHLAKEIGFKVINMDLIVGLPSEGKDEIINTLMEIEKLDPENLTVHTLAVKRGSKFKETMDRYIVGNQYTIEDMIEETTNFANKMDLNPYYLYRQKQMMGNFENIGYSKEGTECIYNMAIMEEKETIIGAGMGAVSKIFFPEENRLERVPNFKDMKEYLERTDELIERKKKGLTFLHDNRLNI